MSSSAASRTRRLRPGAIVLLSAAGVAVAAYLSWVALGDGEVACGPAGDCRAVQDSRYSEVVGVPVALLGLGMYAALLALSALTLVAGAASPPVVRVWTFALALGGVLYSAYLTYLELFVIDAICSWCVVSALLVTAIFALSAPELRSPTEGRAGGRSPKLDV